jgi:hypothetical protein
MLYLTLWVGNLMVEVMVSLFWIRKWHGGCGDFHTSMVLLVLFVFSAHTFGGFIM